MSAAFNPVSGIRAGGSAWSSVGAAVDESGVPLPWLARWCGTSPALVGWDVRHLDVWCFGGAFVPVSCGPGSSGGRHSWCTSTKSAASPRFTRAPRSRAQTRRHRLKPASRCPRWAFHFVTVTVDSGTVDTARQTASIIVASVRCSPVHAIFAVH